MIWVCSVSMSHKKDSSHYNQFFFQVGFEAEGEARRYFVHALMLRDTVRFLRYNKNLCSDMESGSAVDLIRCESLLSLEPSTRSRVLNKNYRSDIRIATKFERMFICLVTNGENCMF